MAVRRRQVRQLGGKRLLIALVIVCLAAAGLCAYLLRPRAYQTPSPAEDTSVLFSDRASADVARLLIRNGQGETYEITQRDGQAAMDGDAGFDFSASMLDDALRDAAQVYAQRVILELKDKLAKGQTINGAGETYGGTGVTVIPENKLSEAGAALAVLGYSQGEINVALKGIDLDSLTLEEIIKQALKKMMKG